MDSLVLGLRVAAAVDVLSLPVQALEDPPMLVTQAGYDTVRAVVRQEGVGSVMVLSLEHILESLYRMGISNSSPTQPVTTTPLSGQGEGA